MEATLRNLVRQRAGNRCEYCRLHQTHVPYSTFHIDHIIPRKHGGSDNPSNLALACNRCNRHKGSNLTGIDPESGTIIPLFHPRNDTWVDHFAFREALIVGLTPIGRATVYVLNINARERMQLRTKLLARGQLG
jgi:5-methylcytosine-specific restriction endonuclease McrA